jgi:GH24 family phage-related lysozyme (muramidase)
MRTSLNGILAIINEEAMVLQTYKDAAGVATIGVGHTAAAGGVIPKAGNRITIEQGIALLASDLAKFERRVLASVNCALRQHEFDALVMFDFNTGAVESGTVDDKLDAGKIEAAMATLQQYDKAKGKKLAGLDHRRDIEEAMFRRGAYPRVTHIKVYDRYPGKLRLVPVSTLDLSKFEITAPPVPMPDVVSVPVQPAKPRGLLAFFIDLILSLFPKRT